MTDFPTGAVLGDYRVDGLLGRGGMATVYRATHATLGRQVALKLLDAGYADDVAFVARFRREGQLQASLEHPNVVGVYEAGESVHGLFLAMQLITGDTLSALIASGELTPARALTLLDQVADALDAAHAVGLVHRDVKPRNVLLAEGDRAFLADFGLSKLGADETLTITGELMGTLAYLAPEVIRGEPTSPAADRYAFAAMAFECLTGSIVYPRSSQAAQLFAHTSDPVPQASVRRPGLPPEVDAVFAAALSKTPEERPRTAREIVTALDAALAGIELAPAPPDRRTRFFTPDRGHKRVFGGWGRWLAAGLAGAAVASAGWALVAGDDAPRRAGPEEVPPLLPGTVALGSDLRHSGPTRDCNGRPAGPQSPSCTVVQSALPGANIVVPRDGVIRRWALRGARGEFQIAVLRPRDAIAFQVAVSANEFVPDRRIYAFPTDVAVEAGDIIGLQVVTGSGVGLRARPGAQTQRWVPPLRGLERPADRRAGTGFDGEVLLRVEYTPGARQRLPAQVSGPAAAKLPNGKVLATWPYTRTPDGRRRTLRVVAIANQMHLELVTGGRRLARVALPGFTADGGDITAHSIDTPSADGSGGGITVEYVSHDSVRTRSHYFSVGDREFFFVN